MIDNPCECLEHRHRSKPDGCLMRDTASLIRSMWAPRAEEIRELVSFGENYVVDYIQRHRADPAQVFTTSREDCALLYLLIRHFRRRSVFEVGTGIGTSAASMARAIRRNGGGRLVTSDPVDRGAVVSDALLLQGSATEALILLRREGFTADFCFIDWPPDKDGLALLRQVLARDVIIAVHDHNDSDPKGREVVASLASAGVTGRGKWFLPSAKPDLMEDGTRVNNCTAFWLPEALLRDAA